METYSDAEDLLGDKWTTVEWRGHWESGEPCVATQRLPARNYMCWKCYDGRTRSHSRRCSERGGKWARLRDEIAATRREFYERG